MRDLMKELTAGAVGEPRAYLILFPASGTLKKLHGTYSAIDMGAESGWTPFIYGEAGATALDPRCMVYEAETLRVIYHPRDYIERMHPAGASWLKDNKDVFAFPISAGFSLIGKA